MGYNREKVITSFRDFLVATEDLLSQINIIYFAYIDAHTLLSDAPSRNKFLAKLSLCKNLSSLTLFACQLQDQDLLLGDRQYNLSAILKVASKLKSICLRNNHLTQAAVASFEKDLISSNPNLVILFPGASTCPAKFDLSKYGWQLSEPWTELEFEHIIAVSENYAAKSPRLLKLHAYRASNDNKRNHQYVEENSDVGLPISALLINGRAFLLPKYITTPETVSSYNELTGNRVASFKKHISLVLHKDYIYSNTPNQLKFSLAKIYARALYIKSNEDPMEGEMYNLFRHGDHTLGLRRKYAAKNPTGLIRKRYLIQEYIPGPDCFTSTEQLYYKFNFTGRNPKETLKLDSKTKEENIRYCLAFTLEAMSLQFMGIIHGDIKPDNWIQAGLNNFRAIDFGMSLTHDRAQYRKRISACGTFTYMAPEMSTSENLVQTTANDAFSLGISIRQQLYTLCYLYRNSWLFLNDREVFSKASPELEQQLRQHFATGIRENYGATIALIIDQLTLQDPKQRMTISRAFSMLAIESPQIAQQVFAEKINLLKASISNILCTFDQANGVVADKFPDWNNSPAIHIISDTRQQHLALNFYCKLLTLNFFLQIYYSCNGVLPNKAYSILEKSIQDLATVQHECCTNMNSIYYTNDDIESVMRFHYKFLDRIFTMFTACAVELSAAPNNYHKEATELNIIQTKIRDMWLNRQPIYEIAEYIVNQYINLQSNLSLDTRIIANKHLQGLINDIESYSTEQHSPKSPRLTLGI